MASAIDNGSSSTADNMEERAHFDADGRVIRPAQITAGVVKFAELMASTELLRSMMRDYLTPYDMARLSRSCVAFHATCQPVLPKANPFTMLTEFGKDAPRLRGMLESNNPSGRNGALDWLWHWGAQVSPGRPHGQSRAAQVLESLPSWQFSEVQGETQCPEFLKDAFFSELPGAFEMARTMLRRYTAGNGTDYRAIKAQNNLETVTVRTGNAGTGTLTINERCRAWLRLPDAEARSSLVEALLHMLDSNRFLGDAEAALAAFLRADPERDDPAFAQILANVMKLDRDLLGDSFTEALKRGTDGLKASIVDSARELAIAAPPPTQDLSH